MDVLHVITTISRGGAENHLKDLISGQVSAGLKVGVAWLKGSPYWKAYFEGLSVVTVNLKMRYYGDVLPAFRLVAAMKKWRPRILHAHLPPAELYCRFALWLGRSITFIISKHNDSRFYNGPGASLVGRWTAARAKKVICISKAVSESPILNRLCVPQERKVCIYYGIDPNPFVNADGSSVRRQLAIPDNHVVFGCIARLVPQKDHRTLLRAFAKFCTYGNSGRLLIVGEGPLERQLKQLASELGVSDMTTFTGFREDIPDVLAACDVVCLTSEYEGFGLVLIEAMAARRPIIATKVSSIPEIVVHGVTGLLTGKHDAAAVATGMSVMMQRDVRRQMGIAAFDRVQQEFTLQRMHVDTLSLYRSCGVTPQSSLCAE